MIFWKLFFLFMLQLIDSILFKETGSEKMGEYKMSKLLKCIWSNILPACLCTAVLGFVGANELLAATNFTGSAGSNWWFNPANWSKGADFGGPFLPSFQGTSATDGTPVATDAQINIGQSGAWNVTGEGVVYDPANDPFFAAAAGYAYPTGSGAAPFVGSDYGPQHIYRMYIGRNVTDGSTNLLTIKSGNLVVANTFVIGRSGSTVGNENLGKIVQTGGSLRTPVNPIDIGQAETSGWGNGAYDYQGGTLEVDLEGVNGIRLAHGGGNSMAGGKGTFIMHNPASGGYVRAWRYQSASHRGGVDAVVTANDPDGITTGVATTQFHYENGGTRPIQVAQNLSINNGLQADTLGTTSSRLDLVLHQAACAGAACVPNNIGLFDVDFDIGFGSNGGIVAGSGAMGGTFSSADGATQYTEGSTVSATFGGTRYDWAISYSGNITWTDANNSVVNTITGIGSGVDVVLMGLGSESVGIPGDFDGDSDVDGRDFMVWQRNTSVGNLSDWQANYGAGGPLAAVTAVPEPGSLALLAAAVLPLLGRRRG